MKIKTLCIATLLASSTMFGADFIDYSALTKKLKSEYKEHNNYATTQEVKKALNSDNWIVVDVRTLEEWSAAYIQGSQRVGRQAPEKALENFVLDDNGKFVRNNIIVVCNSAARASIEAENFKKMGFNQVKIYDLYSWIDQCNPVTTKYTVKTDKNGTGLKFGNFYAEHCKK